MATKTEIPVTVSDEALARIEEIGMPGEFDRMIEHAKQTIPRLRALEASLEFAPWLTPEPKILITAHRPHLGADEEAADREWRDWFLLTFPPEVFLHFLLMPLYEAADGR